MSTPTIPGMTVTTHTCDEIGVCQNTGLCEHCSDGTGSRMVLPISPEVGNVWFDEPEPMSTADRIARTVLLLISAVTAIGLIYWLVISINTLTKGV